MLYMYYVTTVTSLSLDDLPKCSSFPLQPWLPGEGAGRKRGSEDRMCPNSQPVVVRAKRGVSGFLTRPMQRLPWRKHG